MTRILVVGDAITDRYCYGRVKRLNPEAPGIVFDVETTEDRPGGAAAVSMLCKSLDTDVRLIAGEPRCIKQRCVVIANGESRLLHDRIDFDVASKMTCIQRHRGAATSDAPWQEEIEYIQTPDAIIVADYGKGAIGDSTVDDLHKRWPNVPIVVDPARGANWQKKYLAATLIKANEAEWNQHVYDSCFDKILGEEWVDRSGPHIPTENVVVTYGHCGIGNNYRMYPARKSQLIDVTGAGDTVAAVLGVCLAKGIELPRACELANIAAGLQVERIGVSPITWAEIEKEIEPGVEWRAAVKDARAAGKKIVVANGVFDCLHAGHLSTLEFAKQQGDFLLVAVNSDASTRRLKGDSRPIIPEAQRMAVLRALRCVDAVVSFHEDSPVALIREIQPDVLVKGGDYTAAQVEGSKYAGVVRIAPLVDGVSTTEIIGRNCSSQNDTIP